MKASLAKSHPLVLFFSLTHLCCSLLILKAGQIFFLFSNSVWIQCNLPPRWGRPYYNDHINFHPFKTVWKMTRGNQAEKSQDLSYLFICPSKRDTKYGTLFTLKSFPCNSIAKKTWSDALNCKVQLRFVFSIGYIKKSIWHAKSSQGNGKVNATPKSKPVQILADQ